MLFFVFLLPAIAYAQIYINVDVASQEEDVKVYLNGSIQHTITDDELSASGLSESEVINWFRNSFHESIMLMGILKNIDEYTMPEAFTYTYTTQIRTTIKPVKATVVDIDSESTVLAYQNFKNTNSTTVKYRADLSKDVTTTVSHATFDAKAGSSKLNDTSTAVNILVTNITGRHSLFSDVYQWGTSNTTSQTTTVRTSARLTIPVKPYHTLDASLMASHGSMKIEVLYDLDISGTMCIKSNIYTECETPYELKAPVDKVLQWLGKSSRFEFTEILNIDFYTDVDTKLVVTSFEMPDSILTNGNSNSGSYSNNPNFWFVFLLIFYRIVHVHI